MSSDSELLRQYLENSSEAAFAELVRRHVDFVYGVALRHTRNPHRAEDAAQQVFVALARKSQTLSGRTELLGWLYTSTRYAAAKIVRSEARRQVREREAELMQADDSNAASALDWQRLQPVLDDALEGLEKSERSALLLRYFRDSSFREIGAALQVSEEAARKRVDRSLEKLQFLLARRGISSTAAALGMAIAGGVSEAAPPALAAKVIAAARLLPAGSGPAAMVVTFLHAMSTSKAVATIAVLAGILSVGSALQESAEARRADAELAELRQTASRIELALQAAQKELMAAQSRAEAAAGARKDGQRKPAAPAAADQKPAVAPQLTNLINDPKFVTLARASARSTFRERYGPFFASQHWSPAQIEAFLRASADQMFNLKVSDDGEAVAVGENTIAAATASERALLGDAGFQQLQAYEQGLPYQDLVQRLAGTVYNSDPLSPQQAEQMVQLWVQNNISYRGSPDNDDWQGLLNGAQGILTGRQLETLHQMAVAATGLSYSIPGEPNGTP
jgi:RNA polymerase sigma factor (sigma-70 family)